MQQRGRKGKGIISTAAQVLEIPRLPPPAELSEFEAHCWTSVVNTKPADWFRADTLPILLSYCKHISCAYTLDKEIAEFDPAWLRDDDGLLRYKRLTDMRDRESRALTALARSMRLTQQSQIHHNTAASQSKKTKVGGKPWE